MLCVAPDGEWCGRQVNCCLLNPQSLEPACPLGSLQTRDPLGSHPILCALLSLAEIHKLNICKTFAHSMEGVLTHSGKWTETPFQINDEKRENINLGGKNETVFNLNVTNASAKAFTKGHSLWVQRVNLEDPIIQTDENKKRMQMCVRMTFPSHKSF